jgi:phosphomevalonate kinase
MENNFSEVMEQRSDAELLKIVNEQRNDYQPQAVLAAEKELAKRNLSANQVDEAKKENEIKAQIESDKANKKLGSGWKVLTFIFPGIILIIFAGTFKADGYDKKARELTKWTLYGFGFYFGLVILIMILNRI